MSRGHARDSIPAATFLAVLDAHTEYSHDLDGKRRYYINNKWVDGNMKRMIRRYRNGHVDTVRYNTVRSILDYFNISYEEIRNARFP